MKSVFVVEDDPLIRIILVEELVEAGYVVAQAESGDEAIAMFNGIEPPPAILITDIHMPGSHTGLDVADHVRRRFPDLPIIYTTGRPDTLRDARRMGANQRLVRKPYSLEAIITGIREMLAA